MTFIKKRVITDEALRALGFLNKYYESKLDNYDEAVWSLENPSESEIDSYIALMFDSARPNDEFSEGDPIGLVYISRGRRGKTTQVVSLLDDPFYGSAVVCELLEFASDMVAELDPTRPNFKVPVRKDRSRMVDAIATSPKFELASTTKNAVIYHTV